MNTGVQLLIPAELFPNNLATNGFLTPTPFNRADGLIRVFGGARDSLGKSRIMWVDIDPITLKTVNTAKKPILNLGAPGTFDSEGMILGDIKEDKNTGLVLLTYVGFSNFPTIKFRAYSGLAISEDQGESFRKVSDKPLITNNEFNLKTSIIAIHNINFMESGIELLVAIGCGWQTISRKLFPRYEIWQLSGPDLDTLELSNQPIIKNPPDVYRLGRPRSVFLDSGSEAIIATGGKVNGDYRPYIFKKVQDQSYVPIDIGYEVKPGISPLASLQAAYPVHIKSGEDVVALFNGDLMGKAGVLSVPVRGFS